MEALSLVEARAELSKHCITYRSNGAEERNRTVDLFITNELLYQLSYFGILDHKPVNIYRKMGSHFFEPTLTSQDTPNLAEHFKCFAQLYFVLDARRSFDTAVDVEVVGCCGREGFEHVRGRKSAREDPVCLRICFL